MPRLRTELLLAAFFACAASGCRAAPEERAKDRAASGARPEGSAKKSGVSPGAATSAEDRAKAEAAVSLSAEALLKAPAQVRWSTPGGLRWRLELSAPVTSIRSSMAGGLILSVGETLENVTSRGIRRWAHVAGKGHRIFGMEGQEIVWSPEFGKLSALLARGEEGWSRRWDAGVVAGALGEPLLVDAATVSAVGPSGEDKWRAVMDGLRKLSEPFLCEEGMLFQGSRGLAGVAVTISSRGKVVRETELERGAVVVGASSKCEPLVWNGAELGLLDARGLYLWRREYASLPFVERLSRGFLLASGGEERPLRVESVSEDGHFAWVFELPLFGRFSRFAAVEGAFDGAVVAGLCLDTESACSNADGDRGPFNALIRVNTAGAGAVLERQVQGHIGMARLIPSGLVTASSSDERSTEVSLRDAAGAMRTASTLPGRLTAGPFVGKGGEVFVATCNGWKCAAPFSLFAITGIAEPVEEVSP